MTLRTRVLTAAGIVAGIGVAAGDPWFEREAVVMRIFGVAADEVGGGTFLV